VEEGGAGEDRHDQGGREQEDLGGAAEPPPEKVVFGARAIVESPRQQDQEAQSERRRRLDTVEPEHRQLPQAEDAQAGEEQPHAGSLQVLPTDGEGTAGQAESGADDSDRDVQIVSRLQLHFAHEVERPVGVPRQPALIGAIHGETGGDNPGIDRHDDRRPQKDDLHRMAGDPPTNPGLGALGGIGVRVSGRGLRRAARMGNGGVDHRRRPAGAPKLRGVQGGSDGQRE